MLSCFNPDHSLSHSHTQRKNSSEKEGAGEEIKNIFFAVYYHKYKDQTGKKQVMSQYHRSYRIFIPPRPTHTNTPIALC